MHQNCTYSKYCHWLNRQPGSIRLPLSSYLHSYKFDTRLFQGLTADHEHTFPRFFSQLLVFLLNPPLTSECWPLCCCHSIFKEKNREYKRKTPQLIKVEKNKILIQTSVLPQSLYLSVQVLITYHVVGVLQQLSQCLELKLLARDVQVHKTCRQRYLGHW